MATRLETPTSKWGRGEGWGRGLREREQPDDLGPVERLGQVHCPLGGLPERRLWQMTDRRVMPPLTHAREWLNRNAPTCRWGLARAWFINGNGAVPCSCRRWLLRAQSGG